MKRRSDTKRRRSHVYFTDADLGRAIPEALQRAGYRVERHDVHFPPGTPDPRWLERVGKEGWVAFTRNKRIRYVQDEIDMAMRAGVPLFALVGEIPHRELAENLVRTMPKVEAFLDEHDPPFFAKIYRPDPKRPNKPGRIRLDLTRAEWEARGRYRRRGTRVEESGR